MRKHHQYYLILLIIVIHIILNLPILIFILFLHALIYTNLLTK